MFRCSFFLFLQFVIWTQSNGMCKFLQFVQRKCVLKKRKLKIENQITAEIDWFFCHLISLKFTNIRFLIFLTKENKTMAYLLVAIFYEGWHMHE